LVTDFPVIIIAALLLGRFSEYHAPLGVISTLGGLFMLYLAYGSLRTTAVTLADELDEPRSFRKGVFVNALNPHFYIFWFTVGAPLLLKGWGETHLAAIGFAGAFLVCIVGAKISMAMIAGASRDFLSGKGYLYIIRGCGMLLAFFGLSIIKDGFRLLGLVVGGG
jgi:threonine/homoserine/homoserine lactone efflux protein